MNKDDDDDITANYHRGNLRSVEAHESIKHRKHGDYLRILNLLHQYPDGLISQEAGDMLGIQHQTCSARFSDMKKKGWLAWNGKRLTRSGRNADVWQAVMPISGLPLLDQPQAPTP